jgi:hypothetical protein
MGYRCYNISHNFLELVFIVDASDFSRLFEKWEPLPTKNIHTKKDSALTHKKLTEIIIIKMLSPHLADYS